MYEKNGFDYLLSFVQQFVFISIRILENTE